ncbi:glycosyltransferase [Candidatus Halobonum tyrrellensis]|uniref:Glycosyltransferase 2-like domain-containing protein n=1 Tax=Candidatus Halobonum tyrrellensis G22 TaxID=1324957 RepID=V4J1W8_9EURY|nr:glycosyltransferase family 2 protein [Candidatus Halobonum tyrrellensis]ESP89417.1 hypothetical protein K933_04276 [Candidatus Halobonum tyrrellensis G22]
MVELLSVRSGVALLLWGLLVVYGLSALWWLVETTVLARGWRAGDEEAWGLDEVQVRVLTVDAEAVVQGTVDAIPDGVADVRVVAERGVDVDGATVHVVPDAFDCRATNKGRAVEWARRHVDCDREYVLYLDEDTVVTEFTGLPDADVVQFTEKPIYTGSRLAYLCEVFRVGYQFEQFGFHRLRYPLYAWGGGFAVRHDVESELGWDRRTLTEDTNFLWYAASVRDVDYRLLDKRFRNQAPPSIRAMLRQRRRWMSGTVADDHLLPLRYRPLYATRVVAWAFSPFVPVLVAASLLALDAPSLAFGAFGAFDAPSSATAYGLLSTALLGMLFVYMLLGVRAYRKSPLLWPLFLTLTPVAVVAHSAGSLWGILRPVEEFEVTEKVPPETVEAVNPGLATGDLSDHDGTERLVRESADGVHPTAFED